MKEMRPYLKYAFRRISQKPPEDELLASRWQGFLTRLCRTCEQAEQLLILIRTNQYANGRIRAPYPPAAEREKMDDYPRNTCKCKHKIIGDPYCWTHQRDKWNYERERMKGIREENRLWLANCAIMPYNPIFPNRARRLCTANESRVERRGLNHTYLACRCGEEVVATVARAEVFMCMVCAGIVEVTPMLANAVPVVTHDLTRNHANHAAGFALRRRQLATPV